MKLFRLAIIFGLTASSGLAGTTTVLDKDGIAFTQCKEMVAGMALQLGVKPLAIVDTKLLYLSKLFGSEGEYLFTCSAPDRKLIVTLTN